MAFLGVVLVLEGVLFFEALCFLLAVALSYPLHVVDVARVELQPLLFASSTISLGERWPRWRTKSALVSPVAFFAVGSSRPPRSSGRSSSGPAETLFEEVFFAPDVFEEVVFPAVFFGVAFPAGAPDHVDEAARELDARRLPCRDHVGDGHRRGLLADEVALHCFPGVFLAAMAGISARTRPCRQGVP